MYYFKSFKMVGELAKDMICEETSSEGVAHKQGTPLTADKTHRKLRKGGGSFVDEPFAGPLRGFNELRREVHRIPGTC